MSGCIVTLIKGTTTLAAQVGASVTYTVGAGGASVASGAGGSGSITVEELYN